MTPSRKKTSVPRVLFRWFGYLLLFILVLIGIAYGVAAYNEQKILDALNAKLKTAINGDVQVGGLRFTLFEDFPTFSISLSDIYLSGPQYEKYNRAFFNAEKIYVNIQPLQLLTGTISLQSIKIRNATVFVFRASDGYTNMDTFKKKEKTDTIKNSGFKPTIDLQKISFENTQLTYVDSVKHKAYGLKFITTDLTMDATDTSKLISISGGIHFDGLMLNESKGSYLKDKLTQAKLNLEIVRGVSGFLLRPSELQFEKSTIGLSGQFKFEAPGSFVLNIHSPNLDYAEGTTIVTKALFEKLGKYQISDPIDLKVNLDGSLAGGEPKIDMEFSAAKNDLKLGKLEVKDMDFKGTFMNHVDSTVERGDPNSRIAFESFSGRVSGVPTQGRVSITNLKDPDLDLDSHMRLALKELNDNTDTTRLKFTSGTFSADISYQGKLSEYMDEARTSYNGKLLGAVEVKNAGLQMPIHQKVFDKGDVSIQFTGSKTNIERANFRINGNPVEVKGSLSGFIPFFFAPDKKGLVDLSIYSPRLDLTPLIKKKVKSKRAATSKAGQKISELLDMLYEKVEFNLALKIDEVIKDSFRATAFEGKVQLEKGNLNVGPIRLKAADGTASLTFQLKDLDKPVNDVKMLFSIKNADVKKYFNSFDNFNQKSITADNISGKLSTRVELTGRVDDQFKIDLPVMSGNIDFKLVNGRLRNFEPLEKMSNFLFKNRDFSDVEFAEIKSKIKVQGTSFDIERMEIQSSVLFMFIEGRYSLKDSTALSIQVPLKNLKKHDANYKPANVGTDAKIGASIFLYVHQNKEGKMTFSYDPFKKHKKK